MDYSPIFIVCWWPSNEREVSLRGAQFVSAQLKNVNVVHSFVEVTSDLHFILDEREIPFFSLLSEIRKHNGVIYPIMHGAYGEDGIFASLCEAMSVPILCSSSTALALMMDKDATKQKLQSAGIWVPFGLRGTVSEIQEELWTMEELQFPLIFKPNDEGSSQDLFLIENLEDLNVAFKNIADDREFLLEEYISGREFSVGVVLYDGKYMALPPTEIILTKTKLFDYEAKYNVGGCLEVTPAECSPDILRSLQETALKSHHACGASYISRTDMILDDNWEIVVLEINAIPGMTETSFIPAQLKSAGITVADLVKWWIQNRE